MSSSCRSWRRPDPRGGARDARVSPPPTGWCARGGARAGRAGARFPWESARERPRCDSIACARPCTAGPWRFARVSSRSTSSPTSPGPQAATCDWSGDAGIRGRPRTRPLHRDGALLGLTYSTRPRRAAAHIYGVIGPDEYHEPVDDNAFTNVMARWNLRRAADSGLGVVPEAERSGWLDLRCGARRRLRPADRLYEQFAGFYALEPLVIADIAPHRPIAADLLLGAERTRGAQVLKQADVLMLHHLVPDEMASGSLEPNLEYYEQRTAHGSSLSPGDSRVTLRAGGSAERRSGGAEARLPDRRRGLDRDDCRGSASRDHGRRVAGTRPRVRRSASKRLRARSRSAPSRGVGCARAPPEVSRLSGPDRIEHEALEIDADPSLPISVQGWLGRRFVRREEGWEEERP